MVHAFDPHDHGACAADALGRAEAACAARGLRLTPVRRRVLEILLESHAALGAYEVLARLGAEGLGTQPPVAYRAINFLVEQGFAHRIEGLSAYVACLRPGGAHQPSFLVCRSCRRVSEEEAPPPLGPAAAEGGFAIERTVLEAQGLCPACQGGGR